MLRNQSRSKFGREDARYNRRVQEIRDTSVFNKSRTSHYEDKVRIVGEDITRQVANMSRNALNCDVREFNFFKRFTSGRRCSCFLGQQTTPDSKCQICFGVGITGGFEKFGTKLETLDVTSRLHMINVEADYESNTRPVLIRLKHGKTKGSLVGTIPLHNNVGNLDAFQIIVSGINKDALAQVFVKPTGFSSSSYINATYDNVKSLLSQYSLDFKVNFERANEQVPSPLFSHIYLRYQLRHSMIIRGDIPKITTALSLGDFGFADQFNSIRVFFDDTFVGYTSDDFFYLQGKGTQNKKWKVIDAEEHNTFGQIITTDCTLALIQPFENYARVPV